MRPINFSIRNHTACFQQIGDKVVLYVKPREGEEEALTRSHINNAIAEGASSFIFEYHKLDPYMAVSTSGCNGEGWYALIEWDDTVLVRPCPPVQSSEEPKSTFTLIELVVATAAVAAVGFGLWKFFK